MERIANCESFHKKRPQRPESTPLGTSVHLTVARLLPHVSIAAGVLILIYPRLLSFVIAAYLIVTGLIGLNDIYHFVR
jgi:hypothetical protein